MNYPDIKVETFTPPVEEKVRIELSKRQAEILVMWAGRTAGVDLINLNNKYSFGHVVQGLDKVEASNFLYLLYHALSKIYPN